MYVSSAPAIVRIFSLCFVVSVLALSGCESKEGSGGLSSSDSDKSSAANGNSEPKISIVSSSNSIIASNTFAIDSKGAIFINGPNDTIIKLGSNGAPDSVFAFGVPSYFLRIDSSDNLFTIPWAGGTVRKITPAGVVSTVGTYTGYAYGAAVDASSNIYLSISEQSNNTGHTRNKILKMTANGVVSTFAGDDQPGYVDANGTSARFSNPQGLTFDKLGNLYVVDAGNGVIRKIGPSGSVSTYAGSTDSAVRDGSSYRSAFRFRSYGSQPEALAITGNGTLFVGEAYGVGLMRVIGTNNKVGTYCGNLQSIRAVQAGPCSASPLYQTGTLVIAPDGDLYFNDGYGSIAKIEVSEGLIARTLARVKDVVLSDKSVLVVPFVKPTSIVADSTSVYWATSENWSAFTSRVQKISASAAAATFADNVMTYTPVTTLADGLLYTSSLALDSNELFWTDNSSPNKISTNGGAIIQLGYGYNTAIAADQNGVYRGFDPYGVIKVDRQTGAASVLAAATDPNHARPYALTVSSGNVFWNDSTGELKKVSTSGGPITTLQTEVRISSMVAHSDRVYWSDSLGIHSISVNGGAQSNLATETNEGPGCVQVDNSGYVYWATRQDIKKVSVNGGPVVSLFHGDLDNLDPIPPEIISRTVNGDVFSNCIAVDASFVYFGKAKGGLYRVAK